MRQQKDGPNICRERGQWGGRSTLLKPVFQKTFIARSVVVEVLFALSPGIPESSNHEPEDNPNA